MSEPFRYRQRVRYHECDPQGVVFNAHYLMYFDIALTELWREAGGYDAMISDGTDMVVAEAGLRYRAPLRFDDEFDVAITVTRLGNTSMVTSFEMHRGGEVVAEGDMRHVFVIAGGADTTQMPDQIREGLRPYAVSEA